MTDTAKVSVPPSVLRALEKASAKTGVELSVMKGFAFIESNFDPVAIRGSSRGLMQIQPAAWDDVRTLKPYVGPYYASGLEGGVFDAYTNACVGAEYLKINSAILARFLGRQPTPAELYLAHQQGAGGFRELWAAASGRSTGTNYVSAVDMRGNPPPDGKGVSVDKGEFYRRWIAAAAFRMSRVI